MFIDILLKVIVVVNIQLVVAILFIVTYPFDFVIDKQFIIMVNLVISSLCFINSSLVAINSINLLRFSLVNDS